MADSKQDIIDRHQRSIAEKVIACIDELIDLDKENIGIEIVNYANPKYYSIIVDDGKDNKIAINIHKVK